MSGVGEQQLVEHAVLITILALHPEHLTISELVPKVAEDRDLVEGEAIRRAVRSLKSSSVLRYTGEVIEPTHPAVRTHELLSLS